jgi:hypothetical protein
MGIYVSLIVGAIISPFVGTSCSVIKGILLT